MLGAAVAGLRRGTFGETGRDEGGGGVRGELEPDFIDMPILPRARAGLGKVKDDAEAIVAGVFLSTSFP